VEIAVSLLQQKIYAGPWVGVVLLGVGLVFVWRSFYKMRIPREENGQVKPPAHGEERQPAAMH